MIDIKISTVVAVVAILYDTDLVALNLALAELTGGESDYFDNELVVIDVGALDIEKPVDWTALFGLFCSYRLNPVAVRNASEALHGVIMAYGLSIDVVAKPRAEATATNPPAALTIVPAAPVVVQAAVPATPPASSASANTMIVDTPVRAGQRLYARGCDLVLTAAVNNGAEIIADGSIHVYAPMRGRALAGASGNAEARIFAASMEPELVSIAGVYRTFDEGFPKALMQRAVQVRLVGERIDLQALQLG